MMNRININAEQIRVELSSLAKAALSSAFKSLFSDIEKKLFSRAEHTINQEDKAEFFELIESLKTHLQPFEENFFISIAQSDLERNIPKTWLDLTQDRTLSLLIEDMIAHAKARYGMEHAQYESRIKLLSQSNPGSIPERFYTLPAIVTAFLMNIKIFKKPLKKDIIRVLGNQVLIKLEPMYMLMNDHLVQLGVLPQIKSIRGNEFSELENIFNEMFDRESILGVLDEANASLTQEEYIEPLPILQNLLTRKKLILRKASNIQPDDFMDAFVAEAEKQNKNATTKVLIATKDKEILRLVGAVIADIINDPQINPVIKKQIHILQTILLHTAFDDAHFFSQINNPARTIVNELAVIGSDPSLDIEKIVQIEALVSNIITEASDLKFSFPQTLRELYRIDGRSSKNDEIALNAIQNRHPEVLARCRDRIATIIRDKVQSVVMSTPAQLFIEEVWAPFLVQILMTHGRQCDEWHEANSVLDGMIQLEAAQPTNAKSVIELGSNIKDLLRHTRSRGFNLRAEGQNPPSIDHYQTYLENIWSAIPSPIESEPEVHTSPTAAPPNAPEPDINILQPIQLEAESTTVQSSIVEKDTETTQTTDSTSIQSGVTAEPELPLVKNNLSEETAPDTEDDDEVQQDRLVIENSKYHEAVKNPQVIEFFNKYVLSDEWFQVFTTEGAALRRLKVSSINFELGVVNFSNRNGEVTLFLPLAQIFRDIIENRSHPVFDNAQFNSARKKLIQELEKMDT